MSDEIVKQDGMSAIQALRALRTMDADDRLAIAKTAIQDGKGGLAVRGLSLIQKWNEGRFWDAFLDEVQAMLDAGRVRKDFDHTDAGASSVREFFELIDGKPDEERFRAFCALFMSANAPNATANSAILDIELMGILRSLSAGEMHLLSAFLQLARADVGLSHGVMQPLAEHLGYSTTALINRSVTALIKEGLISPHWKDGSNTGRSRNVLTDFGLDLLKSVDTYNEFKTSQ